MKNFVQTHAWIEKNIPERGVIVSRKPTVTSFLTGNKSVVYLYSRDADRLWQAILDQGAGWITADGLFAETRDYLVPALVKHQKELVLRYRQGNVFVFEIKAGKI